MAQDAKTAPQFAQRDSLAAAFWDERFERNFTPWDQGGVPPQLREWAARATAPLTVLIPGCGVGHEVRLLAGAGWDVSAIDFAPAAVAAARTALGEFADCVRHADFFTFMPERELDCIYERAFLCALPRARWSAVIDRWAALLPAGGMLAGFFFYDDALRGPPFGADRAELATLLQPHFELIEDVAAEQSIAVFAGRERWQVWRRRASGSLPR